MSQFDELMANIDGLKAESMAFARRPAPERARRMMLLSECVTAGLQAYLYRFEAGEGKGGRRKAEGGREDSDVL